MSLGKNPAHLSMVGGKSPRQQMWEVIRANREEFTVYRVARRSNQHDKTVEKYVACLRLGGYVEAIRGLKRGEEVVFRLIRDNGVEAPNLNADGKPSQQGYTTEAVWRTLRILGPSTPEQIAASVAASGTPVSPSTVQRYFIDLQNAGYLTRNGRHYALKPGRYTGPRPPIVQRETRRQVYDPNLDQVMWSSHGEYQHNRSRSRGAAQAGVADTEENNESGG